MSGIQDSNLVLSTPTFFLSTWWPSLRWPWPMFNESFLQKARTQYGSKKWYSNCGNKGWGDKNQHWWVAWLGWRKRLVSSTHFPCPFKGLFALHPEFPICTSSCTWYFEIMYPPGVSGHELYRKAGQGHTCRSSKSKLSGMFCSSPWNIWVSQSIKDFNTGRREAWREMTGGAAVDQTTQWGEWRLMWLKKLDTT